MTQKEFNALSVLIRHAERDLDYGAGGSYGDGDNFDKKEMTQARTAISFLQRLMVKKQHQNISREISKKITGLNITI